MILATAHLALNIINNSTALRRR